MNLNKGTESSTVDNLFAGNQQAAVSVSETVVSGAGKLVRGTVLGRVTASGKLTKVDSSKNTGEQVAVGVLAHDVDATSADAAAVYYAKGEFNTRALVFGGTDTAATHKAALEARGIIVRSSVANS